jgi:acetyl-CoA/propionyl-CoA carboxylase biotin carboxyl carrier protein
VGDFAVPTADDAQFAAAAAYRWLTRWPQGATGDLWSVPTGWRMGAPAATVVRLRSGERTDHVRIVGSPHSATVTIEGGETHSLAASLDDGSLTVTLDGWRVGYRVAHSGRQIWLAGEGGVALLEEVLEEPVRADDAHSGDAELVSPMPGAVVAVGAEDGATATTGSMVVTVEAMKMEHALAAPVDGVVELLVAVGDQVKVGQLLARITVATEETPQP